MNVSVVMCTRNRSQLLTHTLDSMYQMVIPAGLDWEIVIVDNGSTDNTRDVIEDFREKLPVRHILESNLGVSNARNSAVREAKGDYLLWTDDDVIVHRNWLAAYVNAFRRWPEAAIFGGKITPLLLPPRCDWFHEGAKYIGGLLCLRDCGEEPAPISQVYLPYGPNYAIRAKEQKEYLYDLKMGLVPGRPTMRGEETDVVERLLKAGYKGWWVPGAEVEHVYPAGRQTVSFITDYYEGAGRESVYRLLEKGKVRTVFGLPGSLWIDLPLSWILYRLVRKLGHIKWVDYLRSYSHNSGMYKAWITKSSGASK